MQISVLLPAYNEGENLKNLIPQIKQELEEENINYEIIIVDSMNKTDDTEEIAKENNVKYYHRENGDNYGDAIRTGILKAQNEYLLVMDADGSHSPKELKKLIKDCPNYDIIIGSRYVKNGKTENNIMLIFMSWMVNIAYRVCLKIKVKDISNSLRIYKTEDLKKLDLESNNFDIVEEILIKLCLFNKNYKIKEVPITFEKRKQGKSKRKLGKFILSYIKTMQKLIKIRRKTLKQAKENSKWKIARRF